MHVVCRTPDVGSFETAKKPVVDSVFGGESKDTSLEGSGMQGRRGVDRDVCLSQMRPPQHRNVQCMETGLAKSLQKLISQPTVPGYGPLPMKIMIEKDGYGMRE